MKNEHDSNVPHAQASPQPDVTPPVVAPTPNPTPAPNHDQMQQQPQQAQPFQQQQMQQPQMQQQYMVMQHSVKGIGGWLIFWLVVFSLFAVGYIYSFFLALSIPGGFVDGAKIVMLLFTPFLSIGYLASVVLIAMQKKLGRLVTFATLGLSALYSTIASIVTYATTGNLSSNLDDSYGYSSSSYDDSPSGLPMLIGGILASLVIHALIALYFVLSKRVKETLVN